MADPGLRDVARLAGVSVATTSNYLNRPEKVAPPTAERVQAAIDELGYVPNLPARRLRGGRSGSIGVTVLNAANPFFADVVEGIEEVAETAGLSVLTGSSHDDAVRQDRYLELFEQYRLDGVLLSPATADLTRARRLHGRGIPVVLVDHADDRHEMSSVSLDDVAGGRLAGRHLLDVGCRRVCFVGGSADVPQAVERRRGCEEVVLAGGGRMSVLRAQTVDPRTGYALGQQIAAMPSDERPDGVFVLNDHEALGLVQALLGAGLRIPDDVAVVGYDDIEFAATAVVPLTSVRQPSRAMGETAARMLLAEIAETGGPGGPADEVVFQPELVVRASTTR